MPVKVAREGDARAVAIAGRNRLLAGRQLHRIGFGRTPIRKGDETRLASPCNILAKALGDVKVLAKVRPGAKIKVRAVDGSTSR